MIAKLLRLSSTSYDKIFHSFSSHPLLHVSSLLLGIDLPISLDEKSLLFLSNVPVILFEIAFDMCVR